MICLTFSGASEGAIALPLTILALCGGGLYWAPPVSAPIAVAGTRHARAATNAASGNLRYPRVGILFRPPTGLAVGLALKELARPLVRGDSPLYLGPPFRWSRIRRVRQPSRPPQRNFSTPVVPVLQRDVNLKTAR